MGDLNVPRTEADAIKAIDLNSLSKLIDQCICVERTTVLSTVRLGSCGPYVSTQLRAFEQALANHAKAKTAKKREETEYDVRKAGMVLERAVQQMKARVETEEHEGQLFFVDDQVMPPLLIGERLEVRVSYHWRERVEDNWTYGHVTFSHKVNFAPNYASTMPKRKPSAAQQLREREHALLQEWEHLRGLGLQAVRDYFRDGRNGSSIPVQVSAKADPLTGRLNNFSVNF